ncbi:MAG: hypothetical protein NTX09_11210 [Verrucomicrobia bacterium]|nr:hypothetical protein [Verrucomicrobiota bacterium]
MKRCVLSVLLIASSLVLRAAESAPADPVREANRTWLAGLPAAPKAELTHHGLVAEELRRWKPRGANQGVAVDAHHFYGIGNYVVGKYDKTTGARVAEWVGLRGGATIHLNGGLIQDGQLVLAHSNFPQLPMASSLEYFDPATVQPVKSLSLGIRHGSLTWAEKKEGFWWACFAHYNDQVTAPGTDNRSTLFGKFDDQWNVLESWIFPPQVIASWGKSSSSGGSWGDDGLLYTTGHDEKKLYVLRVPKMGVTLDYVTTIDVPFEGQSWAWDRSDPRVIYGIIRRTGEVVVARIPALPAALLSRP